MKIYSFLFILFVSCMSIDKSIIYSNKCQLNTFENIYFKGYYNIEEIENAGEIGILSKNIIPIFFYQDGTLALLPNFHDVEMLNRSIQDGGIYKAIKWGFIRLDSNLILIEFFEPNTATNNWDIIKWSGEVVNDTIKINKVCDRNNQSNNTSINLVYTPNIIKPDSCKNWVLERQRKKWK